MDLSDLNSTRKPGESPSGGVPSAGIAPDDATWQLANQIGIEVASALTPALDSVRQMQTSGRIDRAGLHALVTQIEQARHASMLGQQIARLAHGGIQQQPETLNLSHALRDVLAQRQDDLRTRGMAVKQTLKSAEVVVDATLLSALLDTLLDWSLRHACTPVDMRLDTKAWPAHARLVCRYGHTPQDRVPAAAPAARSAADPGYVAALDCLSWQLLAQLARTMALHVNRADTEVDTALTLEFAHTVNDSLEGAASIERDGGVAPYRRFAAAGRRAGAGDRGTPRGAQPDPPDPVADGRGFRQRGLRRRRARVLQTRPAAGDRLRVGGVRQCFRQPAQRHQAAMPRTGLDRDRRAGRRV